MKSKPIFTAIFLFIAFAATLSSCKKDSTIKEAQTISAEDKRLANLITSFKKRGESKLKTTGVMSPDSAIWYIGATANYTYGDATHETERTWTDSLYITLPIINGKISESEVYNKYETVIDSLRGIYQGKNEENKQLLAVAIKTHSMSATSLVCKVTGIFAYGWLSNNIQCIFNDIDSYCFWYTWQYRAICGGPNTASTAVTDAAEETQKRIMRCKGVPAGNYWYDPTIYKSILDASQYPVVQGSSKSNYRYAKLYWNSSQYPNMDGCIKPADLNFYLDKTKELINNETTQGGLRPQGYSVIDIDMWGESHIADGYTIYQHQASIRYGVLHVSFDPPTPL
jgi:hypothetical protein